MPTIKLLLNARSQINARVGLLEIDFSEYQPYTSYVIATQHLVLTQIIRCFFR